MGTQGLCSLGCLRCMSRCLPHWSLHAGEGPAGLYSSLKDSLVPIPERAQSSGAGLLLGLRVRANHVGAFLCGRQHFDRAHLLCFILPFTNSYLFYFSLGLQRLLPFSFHAFLSSTYTLVYVCIYRTQGLLGRQAPHLNTSLCHLWCPLFI